MVLRVLHAVQYGACLLGLVALTSLVPSPQPAGAQARSQPVLLLFGDSLTAGYGLDEDDGFPAQLRRALSKSGWDVDVRNGGVSGDTTAGGLARLEWSLADGPIDAAVVELGANDALRGLPPEQAQRNLDQILAKLQGHKVKVLLAGMLAPPNLGSAYDQRFAAIYPALARKHDVPLYPFFLDGAAAQPALTQADGLHPNAKGVAAIVQRMMPAVIQLLRSTGFEPSRPGIAATVRTETPKAVPAGH